MANETELELVSGGHAGLTLGAPGEFASFYVFSMESSGSAQFWELLSRLMAAAGRPLCGFHQALQRQGLTQRDVTPLAMRRLLCRDGYGFGIFFDVNPELRDSVPPGNQKLLFLRDPRNMLVASYLMQRPGRPLSFDEFVQSPSVKSVAERYRRFAALWREEPNVTLLRYEHARSDWREIAAEIAARLKLPVDPVTVASIAADAPLVGDRLPFPDTASADNWSRPEIADLEASFADVLAAFGYAPKKGAPEARHDTPQPKPEKSPVPEAAEAAPNKPWFVPRAGGIFERDPVLLNRLKPNTSMVWDVLGRQVIMEVDATGCRPVIGQTAVGAKNLSVYGCSFTYGIAIPAEETFCSLLQRMFPDWRVENHGVSGYGTAQNLIQLERDTRWEKPELVTFCWIEHHLGRNVAEIDWVQKVSRMIRRPPQGEVPEQRMPRAACDPNGALEMRSVRVPRHDLTQIDLSDFGPDRYYLDLVCFRLFERANAIVSGYGGHFFVTTLWGQLSPKLRERLTEGGIAVVDASLSGAEHLCLPDDPHPNGLANRKYAERIGDYLRRYVKLLETRKRAADSTTVLAIPIA